MWVNSHWFGDRCQSKCRRWRLWWWQNAELTCFIMLPHYLEWRTPASFDKWTSRLTTASFESKINNSPSNLKENNDQNRDSQHSRGPFILLGKKLALNWIWKSAWLKKKIFTKQMSVHCLLVSEVSRERRGVQPWLEALLPTKQFNCRAQIGYLSQSSK